jgi:hypothetical protein
MGLFSDFSILENFIHHLENRTFESKSC